MAETVSLKRTTVDFLRMNRNTWLAAFVGLTESQITTALDAVFSTYEDNADITRSFKTFESASIGSAPYYVVQIYRPTKPIPGGIKDQLRIAVNNIRLGI